MKRFVRPLTQSEFGAFGDVIQHYGGERRHRLSIDFCGEHNPMRQAFWVSKVSTATDLPNSIGQLERHPLSDQAFVPLNAVQFLVVVCPSRPDGMPDMEACEAFVAGPGQGIIYRRNVWHAPLSSLTAPAEFFVTMGVADNATNDEFCDLPSPLHIALEGGHA
ncbi:ureidoglycolate lyase [Chelatococcus sp. GCM10030263]|uniref:ureidoglycolate lyase n=1 Tax=Chelatococcus sp. GCM10030263 TaxID=3273387 RepID=UPI00361A96F9